jgi:hypothetical protein
MWKLALSCRKLRPNAPQPSSGTIILSCGKLFRARTCRRARQPRERGPRAPVRPPPFPGQLRGASHRRRSFRSVPGTGTGHSRTGGSRRAPAMRERRPHMCGGAGSAALLVRSCAERRYKLFGVGRTRIEKLNRNVVVGQPKGDLFGSVRLEPEGGARRRHINRLRISTGATPTASALDHPAPERDSPDDSIDDA